MTLRYEIEFLDYWHVSSGLSAGAKHDASVVKDKDDIVYLPGKTIKGLSREMAELLNDQTLIKKCFGAEGVEMGDCYFSNATVSKEVHQQIVSNKLQDNLYESIASTEIDTNGMAVDNSLREIEVVLPITLYGEISDVPDEYKKQITQSLKMIKRIGLNRNRGLGRCRIEVKEA